MMKFYRKSDSRICLLLLALLVSTLGWGQATGSGQPGTPGGDVQSPKPGEAQNQKSVDNGSHAAQPQPETKISDKEAKELFNSVDEILKFAGQDTALPIKHKVKRKLTSRDAVAEYIGKHLTEDEDAKRLRRSELVLKKFGLLPRDFNLGAFLVALLREQVAGYYDPQTKTVNLLDWVGVEEQRPVLAHELTHALQDQSFDLDKFMKAGDDLTENKREPTSADFEDDEIGSARQAVVEGQAMAVLLDYELAPLGKTLLGSPEIVAATKQGMLEGTDDSVEFRNAPIFWKQSMTFPYRYGLDFTLALEQSGGKEKAFAGAMANPPHSTRQIMEPKTYLSGERLEPMQVPDFKEIFKAYDRFDVGSVGEFDTAAMIQQYVGMAASNELYPHWRGGYYYAVQPKGQSTAALGLLYVSRWSNSERAADFAAIYAKAIPQRYKRVQEDSKNLAGNLATLESLTGTHSWSTEDGAVVIEVVGPTVMVSESLPADVTEKLALGVFPAVALPK